MQRGFAPIIILVGILVIIVIAGGAYYFGKSQAVKPEATSSSPNPVATSQPPQPTAVFQTTPVPSPSSTVDTSNWKTIQYETHIYFKYPQNWVEGLGHETCGITLSSKEQDVSLIICSTYNDSNDPKNDTPEHLASVDQNQTLQYDKSSKVISISKINIDGHQGVKQETKTSSGSYIDVYFAHISDAGPPPGDIAITFFSKKDYNQETRSLIDQILSTFKFTQ